MTTLDPCPDNAVREPGLGRAVFPVRRVELHEALRRYFGYETFRPHQENIVRAIAGGRDALVILPTGAGKSLCYQLPACMRKGTCLVISPLISLMKDQVDAARAKGMRAAYLNSSQRAEEKRHVLKQLGEGALDLLYVAPERFPAAGFLERLQRVPLSLIAIDEAHCISQWGHEFRPDYLQLPNVINALPRVPVAAFTATATRQVEQDIVRRLALRSPLHVRASFNRPNLFYEVRYKGDAERQIIAFVRNRRSQSGIVYRTTRKKVEQTAGWLQEAGIKALPYHAGLKNDVRKTNQDAFDSGRVDVVVATIAFGMGIDKPDIRYVLHGDAPKNLEGYYQETGRAGRDGRPAHCLLLFDWDDVPTLRFFISKIKHPDRKKAAEVKLSRVLDFCTGRVCRRRKLLNYFDEQYEPEVCGGCDVCKR
jgi:ATP-dependent DNA helicase RecQ